MDTAMTHNWHQPIQSIGSSKGDGVCFKHMMRVYFQAHADKVPLNLEQDVVYDIQEDYFPVGDVHALAMLMAQHSASVPDHLSISYLPVSKWKADDDFLWKGLCAGSGKRKQNGPKNSLLGAALTVGCGRKRTLSEVLLENASSSSTASSASFPNSPMALNSPRLGSVVISMIPGWIVAYMSKAMYSFNASIFSQSLFSECPYNHDMKRGSPEFVVPPNKVLEGSSLHTKKLPCIVHMVMHGIIKIHKKNSGAMWIATKAKHKNCDKEELVFMKCWHPTCREKVKDYRTKAANSVCEDYKFDGNGWALVRKQDLEHVIGTVEVDKDAKI